MTTSKPAALLIIDVQKELFEKSIPIYNAEILLQNIGLLIDQAHEANVPVFFIQHSSDKILLKGSAGWQLHPRLQPISTDHIVYKHHGNSFESTTLKEELDRYQIGQLIVTGLVTHGCVKATCLGALELGYAVTLVQDTHSNYHKKAQDVIDEWNEKLSQQGVELKFARELTFQHQVFPA